MAEFKLAALLADFVHREIDDPEKLILLLVHVVRAETAQLDAEHARSLLRRGLLAGGQTHEAVGGQGKTGDDLILDGLDELGNAAHDLAVLVHAEPVGLLPCLDLDVGAELVDLLSRRVEVGDDHGLDHGVFKRSEADAAEQGGGVADLQVDAQIGLVGAVLFHRLVEGDAAEGSRGHAVIDAVLPEDGLNDGFQNRQNVVLGGKGHFHIHLIEFAGGAVAAGVLVAEAGGDLEVAVEAGGHQKLLELLRSLGQSVELAGVLSGGDQIVARALRGGGGQDRGRDLQEAKLGHPAAELRHHVAAQDDVLLDRRVAQIKIAVFQTDVLGGVPAAVDLKGQLVVEAAPQHLDLGRDDLDLAGGELRVFGVALAHDALDGDGGLLVQRLDDVHHVLGLDHDLGRAVEVADDHEGEVAADRTDVLHPADDADLPARVGEPEFSAVMGSVLCHILTSFTLGYQRNQPRIRRPSFLAARPARMRAAASSRPEVICSPVCISLTVICPAAISSSPRKAA